MSSKAAQTAGRTGTDELWRCSANELAALIRLGDVSSREVVEAHLARIEEVNGALNAVTAVLSRSSRQAADRADRRRRSETEDLPPLHGVPISVKENIDCVGSATGQGLRAAAEVLPTTDAPAVERLRAAGAIPIARTNMPEMGLQISTDNERWGLTRNPWDASLTAGGSSGGEAAAIASGMSPLGIGNDIGGSLRNPAFCCGIASLKPTQGRIPFASCSSEEFLAMQLMATNGPMARSVADLRLALRVMHGQHDRDPRSVTVALDGPTTSRRVALVTSLPGVNVDPAIAESVYDAGAVLAAAGYDVEVAAPPELGSVNRLWRQLLIGDLAQMADQLREVMGPRAGAHLHALVAGATSLMPSTALHQERSRLGKVWASFFAEFPIVLGPVWPAKPFVHGADSVSPAGGALVRDMLSFVTPGNLLGLPAVVVPVRRSGDAMPIGVQLYANRFRDDLVLNAADTLERAFGAATAVDPFVS